MYLDFLLRTGCTDLWKRVIALADMPNQPVKLVIEKQIKQWRLLKQRFFHDVVFQCISEAWRVISA